MMAAILLRAELSQSVCTFAQPVESFEATVAARSHLTA